ncbi:uncharacterized protein DEA37_0007588 [Paragonimus westermani]|uniref:Tetraspanin n=1 Tax=Paragonimus westermani TaxID=34504 RepID=A0A5J4P556_9TREM|nr:uncharacterized protein DEA37_0007588 [Paragonimus westermani]
MRRPLIYRQLTLCIFVINGLYFLFGITLIVLGVYTIIDNANISELAGTALYASGVYMLIFFGLIITSFSICGCIAAETENRCMIITAIHRNTVYNHSFPVCIRSDGFIIRVLSEFTVKVYYIIKLGTAAKEIMISTLRNQYGRYKIITDAWNVTQSRLRCCGVDDLGWHVYNDSWWDVFINTDIYEKNAKLTNKIEFQGCFNSLKDYINQYGKAIGALAMVTIVLLVIALALSIMLLLQSKGTSRKKRSYDSHSYVNVPP